MSIEMNSIFSMFDYGDYLQKEYATFMNIVSSTPNKFYVYILFSPDGIPFYVGKGCGPRAWSHLFDHMNELKHINVLKNCFIDYILHEMCDYPIIHLYKTNLTSEDAYLIEKDLISQLGRICDETGPLTNILAGGNQNNDNLNLGYIGGISNKIYQTGICNPLYADKRSDWAKIGAQSLSMAGTRSGCCTSTWHEQHREYALNICSNAGKIGGKITGSKFWWNNGIVNTRSFDSPGEGWVRGMLMSKKKRIQVENNFRKRKN